MARFLLSRKFFLISSFLLFLTLLAGIVTLFFSSSGSRVPTTVLIKRGMSVKQVAKTLEEEGILWNRHLFLLLAFASGKTGKIKAGEYEFQPGMTIPEVLENLVKGQVKLRLITIPEGYTSRQIAQLLDAQKIVQKIDFLQKVSSPELIASLGLFNGGALGPSLEGYLYPETYHLYREMDSEEVIRMMVQQFKKVFEPEWANRPPQMGLSEREVVILAAIIEKETPLPEEKPLVSAVFHNRLKLGIPLQSDPTVIYGIDGFNGNLTREDLQRPSPYNTYTRTGLPPTPICSPGKESLRAALHPAPVRFLYFVSKNDGSHHFSHDIEEHQRAVWKYQKAGRKKGLDKSRNSH